MGITTTFQIFRTVIVVDFSVWLHGRDISGHWCKWCIIGRYSTFWW
jgi:hypothetical protein